MVGWPTELVSLLWPWEGFVPGVIGLGVWPKNGAGERDTYARVGHGLAQAADLQFQQDQCCVSPVSSFVGMRGEVL